MAFSLCLLAGLGLPRAALAQHRGGGMAGGRGGFGGAGGFAGSRGGRPDVHDRDNAGTVSGGLQLGPPGRWWDDKHFAKHLHLRSDQQRRMDAIFEQNRTALLKRYETLQQEEQRMETLTHASTLDENALFSQIDRVEQARADLEKANTHLLFQIRSEMDPDQLSSLEDHH
jgi:Spy/CpxP family protein refolding chaperone